MIADHGIILAPEILYVRAKKNITKDTETSILIPAFVYTLPSGEKKMIPLIRGYQIDTP
jgi:hypothetical protein